VMVRRGPPASSASGVDTLDLKPLEKQSTLFIVNSCDGAAPGGDLRDMKNGRCRTMRSRARHGSWSATNTRYALEIPDCDIRTTVHHRRS
jgi:hypothetical protein